jgi:hypothetical protein
MKDKGDKKDKKKLDRLFYFGGLLFVKILSFQTSSVNNNIFMYTLMPFNHRKSFSVLLNQSFVILDVIYSLQKRI